MSNITVLTPAYNRGKLLEKLYESLCAQDCKDFEWLIVDDGSTDDTSERVEQMKQTADFPISYHRKENGGKHTALNYAYQFIKTSLTVMILLLEMQFLMLMRFIKGIKTRVIFAVLAF